MDNSLDIFGCCELHDKARIDSELEVPLSLSLLILAKRKAERK